MGPDTLLVLGLACVAAGVLAAIGMLWLEARASRQFKRAWDRWQDVR